MSASAKPRTVRTRIHPRSGADAGARAEAPDQECTTRAILSNVELKIGNERLLITKVFA